MHMSNILFHRISPKRSSNSLDQGPSLWADFWACPDIPTWFPVGGPRQLGKSSGFLMVDPELNKNPMVFWREAADYDHLIYNYIYIICIYICICCMCIYIYICIYIYTCMHVVYMCIYIYTVYMYVLVCIKICIYIYICLHIYIYTYVCLHSFTWNTPSSYIYIYIYLSIVVVIGWSGNHLQYNHTRIVWETSPNDSCLWRWFYYIMRWANDNL